MSGGNTKQLAKNTIMLYIRMLYSMVVSLYTSRLILGALGAVDYGLYGVVGGFVAMFSIVSTSLSSAVSRFITFELGKGHEGKSSEVFSTSVLIHIVLAIVVIIVAETVGLWFLNNKMSIPCDRLNAANWVFQASIISFVFNLLLVPYSALIIAYERMRTFAYFGICDTTSRLFIVLFIAYSPWVFDKLIVYALLLVVLSIVFQSIYWVYCSKNFKECNIRLTFAPSIWKNMSSFALWNFIGSSAGILKDQGVNVLLNVYGGPILNAARGIATSVNGALTGFVGNFMMALNPQITKSFASGDYNYVHFLVERGTRFSFYILLCLAIPVFIETDFILTIWLKQYPDYTSIFVRLVLILSLVDTLSNALITLQNATGRIRNYQLVVGGILLLNFPISFVCLKLGLRPEVTYIIAIVIALLCLMARLLFLRYSASLVVSKFLKNVVLNVIIVTIVACIFPALVYFLLPFGLQRFLIVLFISIISSIVSILLVGCDKSERKFIFQKIIALKDKFGE